MTSAPTYTAAQREDGSWGLQCPDGRIIGTAKTEAEAQFGVDVAIWQHENVVAELVESLRWAIAELEEWDEYQKRPERGDPDHECACCMGEMFEPEDRDRIAWAQQRLARARSQ